MNTATIRERLYDYIRVADDKKVKAIYTMVEDSMDKEDDFVLSEEHIRFLDEAREKHLNGKSKSYSWEEAKQMIKSK